VKPTLFLRRGQASHCAAFQVVWRFHVGSRCAILAGGSGQECSSRAGVTHLLGCWVQYGGGLSRPLASRRGKDWRQREKNHRRVYRRKHEPNRLGKAPQASPAAQRSGRASSQLNGTGRSRWEL